MSFELIHKPTFTNQLRAVPNDQIGPILDKIERILRLDPSPHDTLKKKLHGYRGNVYRLRCGDYRIIYTYGDGWVTLLGVDNRKDVYRGDRLVAEAPSVAIEDLPDTDALFQPATPPLPIAPLPSFPNPATASAPSHIAVAVAVAAPSQPLPHAIDAALLARLRIPSQYVPTFLACHTEDDLLNADAPGQYVECVVDAILAPDFDQVIQQPDYITGSVDDLLRYKEGGLLGFLLKLSPEQEKFVTWAVNGAGPTLVKGGPGTGKSTVALYRVRSILRALRAEGNAHPRILFTTYTTALIAYSRQLLESLIGEDVAFVNIRTTDSLAMGIVSREESGVRIASHDELRQAMREAMASAAFNGTASQREAQRQTIERLGMDYLLEEIASAIEARQLTSLHAYLVTPRPGRRVALSATHRTAIWRVRDALVAILARMSCQMWERVRARAAEIVEAGEGPEPYDAVIVDEAQDLDPSVLRLLVGLCRSPNRLFITADANQSIYGSTFRWTDVHEQLQFRGRTGILRANFRSTREIGEAAQSYLAEGMLDDERVEREYRHEGPLPAMRAVRDGDDGCALLARFLPAAARTSRLGIAACAILCPTERAGRSIAAELARLGLNAVFMPGRDLDLGHKGVKVLTLKSAKGLEFPVIALAGFPAEYPPLRKDSTDELRAEVLPRERRTIFVGMTRAMRALLVIVPEGTTSPLLTGFDPTYWNVGQ